MRQVIVSGAAGFIGSEFCRMLRAAEPDTLIHMVDPLIEGSDSSRALKASSSNIKHFPYTLAAYVNSLGGVSALDGIDTVFMFGAVSSVDVCNDEPSKAFVFNVYDVFSFLHSVRTFKHINDRAPKLVYISTDEVGGELDYDDKPWHAENLPATVCTQPIPHSPRNSYSATKAAAEMLIKGMCNQYGIEYVITRCVNNYGYNQGGGKLIPNVLEALESGNEIPIRGKSVADVNTHYRCWVSVQDHCRAILGASLQPSGSVVHVPGQKLRNIELIKSLSFQTGKPFKLGLKPAREAHDKGYQLDGDFPLKDNIHTYFRKD